MSGYVTAVDGLGQENQTWTLKVFEGSHTSTQQIRVTAQTYVDEDRAVIEPDIEAVVQGDKTGSASVDAALIRLDRPVPAAAAGIYARRGRRAVARRYATGVVRFGHPHGPGAYRGSGSRGRSAVTDRGWVGHCLCQWRPAE